MKIVTYYAFDKCFKKVFFNNETYEDMHLFLNNVCNTYHLIKVEQVTGTSLIDVELINQHKK